MRSALIGHSGFVGGTLLAQAAFDDLYRSTDIEEIAGCSYDLLVCAGAPATKWKANQDPEGDITNLRRLMAQLATVEAGTALLISTVDVYPTPIAVYEDSTIDTRKSNPYGRHRCELERFFATHFRRCFVMRLPGLFGRGLRKNFVYDLLRNPGSLHLTHRDSVFQFYDMSRIWQDVQTVMRQPAAVVNVATPPLSAREVAMRCFDVDFDNVTAAGPVRYDMRTRHAGLFGAAGDYIVSREAVLDSLGEFARKESVGA
jgi:nucleoside-diphosphate-sugar epimerase